MLHDQFAFDFSDEEPTIRERPAYRIADHVDSLIQENDKLREENTDLRRLLEAMTARANAQ